LARILRHNRDTEYGRRHGFAGIRNGKDFARLVPVNTPRDLAGDIDKMKCGKPDVLIPGRPIMFNRTSGTTDQPKYVPVTDKGRNAAARTSLLWLYRALRDHPHMLDGAALLVLGSPSEGLTDCGIPYGGASGMLRDALPPALLRLSVLPHAISDIKDYDCRYYMIARLAVERNVSLIATPNAATLLQIADAAARHQETIVRAVRDGKTGAGKLARGGDVKIVQAVSRTMGPNPARARTLENLIATGDTPLLAHCWHGLRLISCWLGGSVGFQVDKLTPLFGATMPKRDIGYLASEGSFTIPLDDGTPFGVPALHANYFEFIPEGLKPGPHEPCLQAHELEEGGRYQAIITNWNGLYRYDIGDVVEVRGLHCRTPMIAFVRKSGDILSITGEKLHVNHMLTALRRLREAHNMAPTQFRLIPDFARARYDILMHFAPRPSPSAIRNIVIPFIDKCLREANVEYDQKRESRRLQPPCIRLMSEDWERSVRHQSIASGRREVQFKWNAVSAAISGIDASHIRRTIEP